ncbi:carbon-nitrogen hydrolase [Zobellella endophytica]|uniref:Carbon-nitrogen hydrolase n=1 Tax=Zobellella endophytica TaxID=2116700 RepID=A0A2P7R2F5_9GAMM|nr:carbon-nitrogen hydrolase family protein [Zobellella endophytica]PSJ44400.1 carbon-nitrogen hydrolase [Zobellella endophytica]
MQIELAQLASREGDVEHNLAQALTWIDSRDPATRLVIFPETHLTGFAEPGHVEDRALAIAGPELTTLIDVSRRKDMAIAIGLLERDRDRVFNTTVLITPEEGVALRYRKTHLWPDERDLVCPGDRLVSGVWRGRRIGLLICYDIEFPETARALAAMGTDLILVTNGNMDPYGRVHRQAALARAQDNQVFIAMTNRAGSGAGLTFAGESAVMDPHGELVAELGRDQGSAPVWLDFTRLDRARRDYHYLADRRLQLAGRAEDAPDGRRYWFFD